mgnify:CR=1 FL=1
MNKLRTARKSVTKLLFSSSNNDNESEGDPIPTEESEFTEYILVVSKNIYIKVARELFGGKDISIFTRGQADTPTFKLIFKGRTSNSAIGTCFFESNILYRAINSVYVDIPSFELYREQLIIAEMAKLADYMNVEVFEACYDFSKYNDGDESKGFNLTVYAFSFFSMKSFITLNNTGSDVRILYQPITGK